MANELPGHTPGGLPGRVQLSLPFVYRDRRDGNTYRFWVVQVNPDNHNEVFGGQGGWATGEHFTQAGVRWRRETMGLPEPAKDARGPTIGTAAWERNRANTYEAIIKAIEAVVLMQGGFQWVQAEHGERQESIPEAIARLIRRPGLPPTTHQLGPAVVELGNCPTCGRPDQWTQAKRCTLCGEYF